MKFKSLVSNMVGKPRSTSESLTGRSSRWIASKFGVSMRTAQRWRKGTQQPKPDKQSKVMGSADADTRRKIAAEAIREATVVNLGQVNVKYPGGRVGAGSRRNVGVVHLDASARARLAQAADALERGDYATAERLTSDALLNSGGRNYGPLEVDDWPAHFWMT